MAANGATNRSDFFEPVYGLQVWRRASKRGVTRGRDGETAAGEREYDAAVAAPDFVEPVMGWRIWRAIKCDGSYVLASLFNNIVWVPGKSLDARCLAVGGTRHRSPDPECRCGVYAAHCDALDWQRLARRGPTTLVVGRVSLWGPVVEAERGWRAEHGYPERLFVPRVGRRLKDRDSRIAAELQAYGVPATTLLVEHRASLRPVIDFLCRDEPARAFA